LEGAAAPSCFSDLVPRERMTPDYLATLVAAEVEK